MFRRKKKDHSRTLPYMPLGEKDPRPEEEGRRNVPPVPEHGATNGTPCRLEQGETKEVPRQGEQLSIYLDRRLKRVEVYISDTYKCVIEALALSIQNSESCIATLDSTIKTNDAMGQLYSHVTDLGARLAYLENIARLAYLENLQTYPTKR